LLIVIIKMYKNIIKNNLHLIHHRHVFFDIFYKNNKIYLILPIYDKPVNPDDIEL